MKKKIPVIVVSGFLGSGKTTFLRYLLKESNKKFGLIINEFGDVGIDGDLIKSCDKCDESEDECIIELNNGCLCCTVQDDFVPSIKALLEFNPPIESIIIETSGLALPIPLIQALNWPEIRSSIYLDVVVGIVNGESMLNGSVYLLLGSLCIGFLTGTFNPVGVEKMQPFTGKLFYGAECFFLLDMGIVAAQRLPGLKKAGPNLQV